MINDKFTHCGYKGRSFGTYSLTALINLKYSFNRDLKTLREISTGFRLVRVIDEY